VSLAVVVDWTGSSVQTACITLRVFPFPNAQKLHIAITLTENYAGKQRLAYSLSNSMKLKIYYLLSKLLQRDASFCFLLHQGKNLPVFGMPTPIAQRKIYTHAL
jgi:hypothetical protein